MELHTARLLIREFKAEDWQAVYAYRRDARYQRFYSPLEASENEAREFVNSLVKQQQCVPRTSFQLAITLPESGWLIGSAGIRLRNLLRYQPEARQADIGYELDPSYWGQGYATEAALTLLGFGFERLELHRIWADCLADNVASSRVLEKLGMRLEGRLRDNEYFKYRWWDTLIYAILEHEWRGSEVTGQIE
jgi:ribosomal-protein-alanine N-acetyltransferase